MGDQFGDYDDRMYDQQTDPVTGATTTTQINTSSRTIGQDRVRTEEVREEVELFEEEQEANALIAWEQYKQEQNKTQRKKMLMIGGAVALALYLLK